MVSSLVRLVAPIALVGATSAVSVTGSTMRVANVVITGTVRDSSSQRPIDGALISIRNTIFVANTDARGTYRLELPDSVARRGSVTIDVRRIGYIPASRGITLGISRPRQHRVNYR